MGGLNIVVEIQTLKYACIIAVWMQPKVTGKEFMENSLPRLDLPMMNYVDEKKMLYSLSTNKDLKTGELKDKVN